MSVYMTPATFSLDRLLIIRKINCPLNEELSRQLSVQMRTTMTVARFVSQPDTRSAELTGHKPAEVEIAL